MKIDVQHLAKLSRLHISEEQVAKFEMQMQEILGMVDNLPELSCEDCLIDPQNPMTCRPDIPQNNYKRDDILKNAPQVQAGCVVVPKVIE